MAPASTAAVDRRQRVSAEQPPLPIPSRSRYKEPCHSFQEVYVSAGINNAGTTYLLLLIMGPQGEHGAIRRAALVVRHYATLTLQRYRGLHIYGKVGFPVKLAYTRQLIAPAIYIF